MQKDTTAVASVIPFRKAELLLVEQHGQPFVPMKPVVEGMGLDWKTQYRKLMTGRFESLMVMMTTTGSDGKQYSMACLPLRKLAGWLMSIQPSKVRAEIKETVIAYQNECDDALWAYWNQGYAIRQDSRTVETVLNVAIGTAGFRCLAAVMDGKVAHLPKALRAGARNHLWSQVHKAFSVVTAEDIPASEMDAARNFIGAYALEGQWLPRQEAANDFDYPAAWIWQNNPALTAGPQRVNGHNGLFLGLKVLAPSEFKSPIWDAIRKLKAQGANTEGLEIEWKARKELMYLLSRIIADATYRLNEHMQHAPFFPVPDSRPLLD